jgi:hypothetical protein
MENEIDDDICRYADVRAPGYLAAMVFPNPHDGRAVLKTPKVITGHNPLCPGPRSIDGKPAGGEKLSLANFIPCRTAKVELRH